MSTKIISHNLDFELNKIINALLNPLTSIERLDLNLSLDNNGYIVWDKNEKKLYVWDGTQWVTSSESFLDLSDTPSSYLSSSGKFLRVNISENGLEFHTLTKSDIGLSNVDNTSDVNKPISNATQAALNNKAPLSHTHTISEIILLQDALNDKVSLSGSYSNPTWLNSLHWAKLTNVPNSILGYGILDAYTKTEVDTLLSGYLLISNFNSTFDARLATKTTSNLAEGSNLYFTNTRARNSLSFSAGSGAYNAATGVITIPTDTLHLTNAAGYLTSFTETDPTVPSHVKAITTTQISNWNTAFSWGNHATFGYLTTINGIAAGGELSGTYANPTILNSAVIGKVLTGLNVTGGSILSTDTILQAFGKAQNQINGLMGGAMYQNVWNASTNSPTITSSVGTKGHYYVVNVAGSTNIDGITDWKVGDWIIFNGTTWDKVDNTDAVSSVNGFVGAVSLTTANIPEVTNLYYTDARSRAALSFTAGSGAYNSSTGVITIPTNNNQIANGAGYITSAALSPYFTAVQIESFFAGTTPIVGYNKSNWDTAFAERNQWDGGGTGLNATAGRASLGLGTMAQQNTGSYYQANEINGFFSGAASITGYNKSNWDTAFSWGNHASVGYLLATTAAATYQPLDADLTAIAALNTAPFGRSLLTLADAATVRTNIGLGSLAVENTSYQYYIGTTLNALNRASGAQTLTGVSIDGNAATATLAANSTLFAGIGYGGGYSSGTLTFYMAYNVTNARWEAAPYAGLGSLLGLGSYAYRSSGLAELSGSTFTGLVQGNSGFRVPNGQYFQAIRTTGGAVINVLGFESGTDDLIQVMSNNWKLRNTGVGDAANLVVVNSAGAMTVTSTVTATSFIGAGSQLTSVPSNAALYPTFNQNTTGNAATATYAANSGLLQGYSSDENPSGSTIVRRTGAGYVNAVFYYSSNTNRTTSGINSLTGKTAVGEGYMYEFTASAVQAFLGLGSAAYINASVSSVVSTVAQRDGAGDITTRLFRTNWDIDEATGGFVLMQNARGVGSDNYARPTSIATLRGYLGLTSSNWVDLTTNQTIGGIKTFSGTYLDASAYRMAAWQHSNWTGSIMQLGGISASQWQQLDLYTNGVSRIQLSTTALTSTVPINGTSLSMSGGADISGLLNNTRASLSSGNSQTVAVFRSGVNTFLDIIQAVGATVAGQTVSVGTTLVGTDVLAFASSGAERMRLNTDGTILMRGALSGTSLSMSGAGSFGAGVSIANGSFLELAGTFTRIVRSGGIRFENNAYNWDFLDNGNTVLPSVGTLLVGGAVTDGTNKLIVNGGVKGDNFQITARSSSNALQFPDWRIYNTSGNNFAINNYTTDVFSISSTGAATFSSSVSAGAGTFDGLVTITNNNARNELLFSGNDFTNIYSTTTGGMQLGISNAVSTGALEFLTANAVRLTIASGGAATFSSSVTAAGDGTFGNSVGGSVITNFTVNGGSSAYPNIRLTTGGALQSQIQSFGGAMYLQTNGATTALTLASNQAATFSSSVTATSLVTSGILQTSNRLYINGNTNISNWISSALTAGYDATNSSGWIVSDGSLVLATSGVSRLAIAVGGQAEFSSSVTANDNVTISKSTGTLLDVRATSAGGTAEIKLNPTSNNSYSLYTAGGTDALEFKRNGTTLVTFSNVGAATFIGDVGFGGSAQSGGSTARWVTLHGLAGSSYTGGIIYSYNGTVAAYHYVAGGYLYHQAMGGNGHFLTVNNSSNGLKIETTGLGIFNAGLSVSSGRTILAHNPSNIGYSLSTVEVYATGAIAPNIALHWGGVVASQISILSSGAIAFLNNPGTAYEAIAVGSVNSSGSADFASIIIGRTPGEYFRSQSSSASSAQFQTWFNSAGTRRAYFGFGSGGSNTFALVNETGGNIVINGGSVDVQGPATFNSSVTATGLVQSNSGFRVPNGQYFQAIRTTGSAVINVLGFESGTDNLVQMLSNEWHLRNTGATNLVTVNSVGAMSVLSSITSSAGNIIASAGDIYLGARAVWLSSWLNQALLTTSNVTFNTVTGTNGGFNSDLRLKNVIGEGSLLNIADQNKVIRFTWKDQNKGTSMRYGYGAQYIKALIPEAVYTVNDGTLAVDYTQVHTVLIDENTRRIKALEARVKELESQLNSK